MKYTIKSVCLAVGLCISLLASDKVDPKKPLLSNKKFVRYDDGKTNDSPTSHTVQASLYPSLTSLVLKLAGIRGVK